VRIVAALKVVLGVALSAALAAPAPAQDGAAPPAQAPAQQPAAAAPAPLPDHPLPGAPSAAAQPAAPSDLQSCLQETGEYVTRGKSILYVIGIANSCDQRLRCEIFANVTGVRGTSLGHTVMILGAAASGAAAQTTYTMPVKAAGGVVQVSRDCKVL
jgi:hypothetical protein